MKPEPPREPFFGGNAKAFAIQFAFGLLILFTVAPYVGRFVADRGCVIIGLCTPEASERLHVSEDRQ